MQHVPIKWLRALHYSFVGYGLALFSAYVAFEVLNVSDTTKARWGITSFVLTIVFIHAVFIGIISVTSLLKKFPWITSIIGVTLYSLLSGAIIESSGNTNIVYRIMFGVIVFLSGMIGLYPGLTATLLTWTILVLTISGIFTPTKASITFNIVADIWITFMCFAGWYLFRSFYVKRTSKETQQLGALLAQEQLKSSVIIESISDGVIVTSASGTVQVINESAAAMLGWTKQEAMGLDYKSLIQVQQEEVKGKPQQQDAISLSLTSNKSEQTLALLSTHHQRQIYVDIVASPILQTTNIPDSSETKTTTVGTIAVLRNVDAQKRQEQQRSDFVSTASHEMRTPVAAIQGFLELALNPKVATVDEKARNYLQKAYDATTHLGKLFQDLLTVSKSDDGRLQNKPEVIEITQFLKDLVEQDHHEAEKKNLKLSFEVSGAHEKQVAPLMYVHADPERLREVVLNLIENAIKYTKQGMITVGASLKDSSVVIRISDTGIGVAEEDIPHLFQKFYRTDNSETREIGGTGLGLYISKQIVEMMGGKIWIESVFGTGSTFFIEVPRVQPEAVERLANA